VCRSAPASSGRNTRANRPPSALTADPADSGGGTTAAARLAADIEHWKKLLTEEPRYLGGAVATTSGFDTVVAMLAHAKQASTDKAALVDELLHDHTRPLTMVGFLSTIPDELDFLRAAFVVSTGVHFARS
jgi:hypothetical protein